MLRRQSPVAIGMLIAAVTLAPLVLVALDAKTAGWGELSRVLFRQRSLMLFQHTVVLALLVCVLAAVIGVSAAWVTECSAVPFHRAWTVFLMLPLAMPDFVVGWAWHALVPRLNPLVGATVVMTLGTYPLIYLPVAAMVRRSPSLWSDTAHSLGVGRVGTFFRVSLPLVAPAVLGGCVLVVLTVISEYGAFEVLRYPTFTTEIFTEFAFEPEAAAALAIPLVLLGLLVLSGETFLGRRAGRGRVVSAARRRPRPQWRLGTVGAQLGLLAIVGLGVGVPIGTLLYWVEQAQHTTLPAAATLGQATLATIKYSLYGAAIAVGAALPVALMSLRHRTRTRALVERSTFVTQALPGVVIALSLVFFATRYVFGLYETGALLVIAYALIHFPLALVCVRASLAQAPASLVDMGMSLGRAPLFVFVRVTLPLLLPGLLAGFCLVFLTAVTELTATLVLAPIGVETLSTQFWAFQSEIAYSAAAPYALVIVALAMLPGAMLGLWFDRGSRPLTLAVLPPPDDPA